MASKRILQEVRWLLDMNPGEDFNARRVARRMKITLHTARHALSRLQCQGLAHRVRFGVYQSMSTVTLIKGVA